MAEGAVREAFISQAAICARLGSPFTARLCKVLADLDGDTAIARRILGWRGDPAADKDNVPLRLCGGLHGLVRAGRAPDLATLYPPASSPDEPALKTEVAKVLATQHDWLDPWLEQAPQTNEVGRSALLMAGLAEIAGRFPLPIQLFELGASAGLNLQLDRFGYDLGGRAFGDPRSSVQLSPDWRGRPPREAEVRINHRAGCDINPMDPARDGERLLAYIWPDQPERLERTAAALKLARSHPVPIAKADAANWIERQLDPSLAIGVTRVILHSIAFQYFPGPAQARIRAHIAAAGAGATEEAPVAWLRFEWLPGEPSASLRLRTWPGEERLLAWAHPHGSDVTWL
ncbi:MAG TPA: DUF2332 family protein [Allosphingosinicella sp.]|nr:DUF2332 family protein [Allosphingosinicella sp.]